MDTTQIIPNELFLLLTNDKGREEATMVRKQALAAAAIVELVLRERVTIGEGKNPTVEVIDAASTGEPVLDAALTGVQELSGKKLTSVIEHKSLDLTERIGTGLADAGILERHDGWFSTRWPVADPRVERALRARLAGSIGDPRQASLQDAILLELLRAQDVAHKILRDDVGGMSRKELDRVIEQFGVDHPAATALRAVLSDLTAVLAASATMVATTTTTTS